MPWFAAISLPQFHLQAVWRGHEELSGEPCAVIEGETSKSRVLEANGLAQRDGVHPGIISTQAQARCANLRLCSRLPEQEQIISNLLREIAGTLSPFIEATSPDSCTIDLQWSKNKNWSLCAKEIVDRFLSIGLRTRVGLAATPDLALFAAKRANPILIIDQSAEFLSELSLSSITAPPEIGDVLRDWGIKSLGELAALSRAELVERLGSEAGDLWDRARGWKLRPLRLVRPREIFAETFEFECAIETNEPLLFILRRMLEQLTSRLRAAYRVAAKMILTLALENRENYERVFTIPAPTRDIEVLFRILHTHLENLQLDHCLIALTLLIEPTKPDGRQFQFFENQLRDLNRFGETLARLTALVGIGNVGVAELQNTHHPDGFRLAEPAFEKPTACCTHKSDDRALGLPLHRFRPPFHAQLHLDRFVPAWIFSKQIHGAIIDASGPYRLSGEWWDRKAWNTEEWDIQLNSGALYCISKQRDAWFVEGCYDAPIH
jgi:protein ImuB